MRKLIAGIGTIAVLTVGLTVSASAGTPKSDNQDSDGQSVAGVTTSAPKAEVKVENKQQTKATDKQNSQTQSESNVEQGPGQTGEFDGEHED
jgi:hypothetical protein